MSVTTPKIPKRLSTPSLKYTPTPKLVSSKDFSFAQIATNTKTTRKTNSDVFSFQGLLPKTKYKFYYGVIDITPVCITKSKSIVQRYGPEAYRRVMRNYQSFLGSNRNFTWQNEYLITDDDGSLHFEVYSDSWIAFSKNQNDFNRNISKRIINESDLALIPVKITQELSTTNSNILVGGKTINFKRVSPQAKSSLSSEFPTTFPLSILNQKGVWRGSTPREYNPIYVNQNLSYNMVQSFYLDSNSFDGAKTVDITEIALYFKNLPINTSSGLGSSLLTPGITVCLLDIDVEGVPVTDRQYTGSLTYKKSSECSSSNDASVDTNFAFEKPIRLTTGRFYGIGIILQSNDFELWSCKTGDRIVGTNKPSSGSSKEHRGELFVDVAAKIDQTSRNRMILQKSRDNLDLKFDIYAAEYTTEIQEVPMVFKDYEFFTVPFISVDPIGGEHFYKSTNNATGTISVDLGSDTIVGTSTDFTGLSRNDLIVITDGTADNTAVVEVSDVIDAQTIRLEDASPLAITGGNYKFTPVAKLTNYNAVANKMVLDDSTAANSSFCFEDGDTIIGVSSGVNITITSVDTFPISVFNIDFDINDTGKSIARGKYNFSYYDGTNWRLSNNNTFEETLIMRYPNHVDVYESNNVKYNPSVLSRSLEVKNTTYLYDEDEDGAGDKSATIILSFAHAGSNLTSYESPQLRLNGTNVLTHYWKIAVDLGNEVFNYGDSNTKHISKPLILGENKSAEDIVVIYNAYRPPGTDIHVYAKIINVDDPEPFDDKFWTKLELTSGENSFSSKTKRGDFKEYIYGFPAFPPSLSTITGTINTTEDSATVTGVGTTFTSDLAEGDVIKIYSKIFPENYGIFQVTTISTDTSITLSAPVSNVAIVDEGLAIDKLLTPYTAFNNSDNLNIVRYFTPNGVYDTYNTVAIKTVLASDNSHVVPLVNDYRVIAVSA